MLQSLPCTPAANFISFYLFFYLIEAITLPPKRKGKKLGIKMASCVTSNKEWEVRIGGWRIQREADVIHWQQSPPKGEQNNKNYLHYLATCFYLFTRLILNAAIPILLVMQFSISQKPEFYWSIKNNEYSVSRINTMFIGPMNLINISG